MQDLAVWAPRAGAVTLRADGHDLAMRAGDGGWWSVADPSALPTGAFDYGYLLDDSDDLLADPRSRRQPSGVHGPSRTFDPAEHDWADGAWTGRQLAGAVIYELHVGTFTRAGTLDAAIEKLDHLVGLGIDLVELLPVNAFNGERNWGYDGVLWYAVQESYGGPAAYQRFVDACHRRGLGVIQDVVYNHLGPSGNVLPRFGPYLRDDGRANTWGTAVNLDGQYSDEVRRYIIDNALMWLTDYHVDGLRLDAVDALADHGAVHLLEALSTEVAALSAHLGRPLTLIAESDLNDPRLIGPRAAGGYGIDAQWNDDFHHVLHVALTDETIGYYGDFGTIEAIAKVLTGGYFHDGTFSGFRGHRRGRPVDTRTTEAWRFVGYSQDHDQIGNRAAGDRLSDRLEPEDLAVAAVLVLTGPFTPMLFMGEEWAAHTPWQFFTSHPEPELGAATARGRLAEFSRMGWDPATVPDPQDVQTFLRSKLDWDEPGRPEHARVLDLYRRLSALRHERAELTDPRFDRVRVRFDEDQRWLVVHRADTQIVVNIGAAEVTVPLRPAPGAILLATADTAGIEAGVDGPVAVLPPHSALVLAPRT
jgi:maltooligosyltrehalose trehalohydrolase